MKAKTAFVSGLVAWSIFEYSLHRFVLHGPLLRWHLSHHKNPQEGFDCKPWIPAGFLAGFLAYEGLHFLIHRYEFPYRAAVRHQKHHDQPNIHFGVTTGFWDRLLGTDK